MTLLYRYTCPDKSLQHPGVPARDLAEEDWDLLTPDQRKMVETSPLYEAIPQQRPAKMNQPAEEPEEDEE